MRNKILLISMIICLVSLHGLSQITAIEISQSVGFSDRQLGVADEFLDDFPWVQSLIEARNTIGHPTYVFQSGIRLERKIDPRIDLIFGVGYQNKGVSMELTVGGSIDPRRDFIYTNSSIERDVVQLRVLDKYLTLPLGARYVII